MILEGNATITSMKSLSTKSLMTNQFDDNECEYYEDE